MRLKDDAVPNNEPARALKPFPLRRAEHHRPPPPASGSLKKPLTFAKAEAADSALADYPSERRTPPVWAWALIALVVSTAVVGSALLFGSKWRLKAAAAAPQAGQLVVMSQPAGGTVVVDGHLRGLTPLTLSLPAGPHSLQLSRADVTRTIAVTVKPGSEATHYVDLETPAIPTVGQLIVSSEPGGAHVSVDGLARGVTPITIPDLTAGEHAVVVQGTSGPIRRTVIVQRGETSSLVVSMMANQVAFGWVSVSSPLVVQVLENDQKLGTSETDRIMMPAGQHTLRMINTRLGFQASRVVHVPAGGGASLKIDPPSGVVNLNALPWAETWIDGHLVGDTPLANLKLQIGDHEALFRHPQLGERRQTFVVTTNDTARVAVDLRK
jgi:hypothetical protein